MKGNVEVICDRCGKKFTKWRYRIRKHNYCSRKCVQNLIEYACKGCGKILYDNPSSLKYKSGKSYCSKGCADKYRTAIITCKTCGKEFKVWKSRNWIQHCSRKCQGYSIRKHIIVDYAGIKYYRTSFGYYVSRPKGKHGIMLHRKVYEDANNITLVKSDVIHHLNGNREDNRIENLEHWTTHHPHGIRYKDKNEN